MPRKRYRQICKVIYKGEPLTKSNGIVAKWNFKKKTIDIGHKKSTIKYETALRDYLDKHCDEHNIKPTKHHVRLKITYWLGTRRLKDLPNLPKTTCDALIGNVYVDDSQIVEMTIKKLYDKENPRVCIEADEILVYGTYTELFPLTYEPEANAENGLPSEKGTRPPRDDTVKPTATVKKPRKRRTRKKK